MADERGGVAFSSALAADEELVLLRRLRGLQKRPLILDRVHPEITAIEAMDGEEATAVLNTRRSAAAASGTPCPVPH